MAARLRKLKVGERVKVNATVFDTAEQLAGIEPRWSVIHFPLTWKTAQVEGKIVSKSGHLDAQTTVFEGTSTQQPQEVLNAHPGLRFTHLFARLG